MELYQGLTDVLFKTFLKNVITWMVCEFRFHYELIIEVKLIKKQLVEIWLYITYMKSQH